MNKEGRYTKAQITLAVGKEWNDSNTTNAPTVNKKVGEKIVKGAVTALTTFGGTAKFTPAVYNKYFNDYKAEDGHLEESGAIGIVITILDDALPKWVYTSYKLYFFKDIGYPSCQPSSGNRTQVLAIQTGSLHILTLSFQSDCFLVFFV